MNPELETAPVDPVSRLLKWRTSRVSKVGTPCANCATQLEGPYCHSCGQLAEDFEQPIGALFMEACESLFHADGRLLHTLPRLILRPAALTRDYVDGRRAPQVPPLRLFLVVILVFFFAGSLRRTIWHSDTGVRGFAASASLPRLSPKGHPNDPPVARWLRPRLMDALAHRREFAVAFDIWLYRIAIVFLPISTLLLSLLFFFGRRFFIFDHAIFSMHSLAFMGLLFTLITLLSLLPPLRGWIDWLALAAPVHLFRHMRGFYRTRRLGTLARMFLLFLFSAVALTLLMAGAFALELNMAAGK